MDSPDPPHILYSPAPQDNFVLLCTCGNSEVSKRQDTWSRFTPDFARLTCQCGECEALFPLRLHDDSHLHYRKP